MDPNLEVVRAQALQQLGPFRKEKAEKMEAFDRFQKQAEVDAERDLPFWVGAIREAIERNERHATNIAWAEKRYDPLYTAAVARLLGDPFRAEYARAPYFWGGDHTKVYWE